MFAFTDDERAYLTEMRGITTNAQGREVLVGLTLEETEFYMSHVRDFRDGRRNRSDSERYLALHSQHEAARLGVLVAENQRRVDNPPLH